MTSKQPNTAAVYICTRSNKDYCKVRHYNNVFEFCLFVSVHKYINSISLTYKDITYVLSSIHKNHNVNSPQHNELDWCSGDSLLSGSRAAVQAVIRRRIPTEARIQSQASPPRISDVQNGTVPGFSPSASVFPHQCHPKGAPYSFIQLPQMPYRINQQDATLAVLCLLTF